MGKHPGIPSITKKETNDMKLPPEKITPPEIYRAYDVGYNDALKDVRKLNEQDIDEQAPFDPSHTDNTSL